MVIKVSLGGLNSRQSQKLRNEIYEAANAGPETMEEYARLIRLIRQGFSPGKQKSCLGQEMDGR